MTTFAAPSTIPAAHTHDSEADGHEVVEVAIADLLRDTDFQVRRALDRGIIDRYAAVYSGDNTMPPVEAAHVNGTLVLVDGWHRVAALEVLGAPTVMARVIPATGRDALWLAARANLKNGLPLKKRELRNVFRKYIRARKHRKRRHEIKSYREMAQDLGGLVRHTTIRNWMLADFPKIAARISGEGYAEGGLRDLPPETTFRDKATDSLQQALAAFRGLTDSGDRGEVIMLAESTLASMRAAGEWNMPDF